MDGGWSEWGDWSTCSKTCGGGEQSRNRECNNPVTAYFGEDCDGDLEETQTCNPIECAGLTFEQIQQIVADKDAVI